MKPSGNEMERETLESVRVLICEATEPRTRDPLLQQAIRLIDAALNHKDEQ